MYYIFNIYTDITKQFVMHSIIHYCDVVLKQLHYEILIIETILRHKNVPNGIETPAVNFLAFPKSLQLALIQRGCFASCVFKPVAF